MEYINVHEKLFFHVYCLSGWQPGWTHGPPSPKISQPKRQNY